MTSNLEELEINGAKVALYKMSDVRAAFLEVVVDGGSSYERGPNWGAFHLFEHMVSQGTRKFSDRVALDIYKEDNGLITNAYTGPDKLGFWVKFPSGSEKAALTYLNEVMFNSTIPSGQLSREISVISQEYRDKWSSNDNKFYRFTKEKILGKGHVYARDGMGDPEYIAKLSREDLIKIKDRFVVPSRMSVSAAGNFDLNSLTGGLRKMLKGKPGASEDELSVERPKHRRGFWYMKKDVKKASFFMNYLSPGLGELSAKQRVVLSLGSYILGGTSRSLLFRKLRQEKGLVYSAHAKHSNYLKLGFFSVQSSCDPVAVAELKHEVDGVLKNFFAGKIDDDDFDRAKNFLCEGTLMSYDSVSGIARKLGNQLFYYNRSILPEEYVEIIQSIKKDYFVKTMNELIKVDDKFVTVMSPKKAAIKP